MKRTFTEYDEDGSAESGRDAKAQLSEGNSFAMKFLFSEVEMRAIGQQAGEIQEMSGATLATTGELYPATAFQELNIAGPNTEAVLSAAIYAIAHIVQVEGGVTNGEEGVPPGDGRLRTVVPMKAAAAVIGKGGANIIAIRTASKLHVHVETAKVPPDGGLLSEQIVSLSGPLAGLQDGLAMVLEHVHELIVEPWFSTWASGTNVGLEFPDVVFDLSGKGMRKGLGMPGKGFSTDITADTSLGVTGEVCQFFTRSGWCRWGEACRHVHSGGPAIPIGLPSVGGVDSSVFSVAAGAAGEVCEFYAKAGWCKFGDACRYVHKQAGVSSPTAGGAAATGLGVARPSAISVLNAFGVGVGGGASGAAAPAAQNTQQSSGDICRFFQKAGWCKHGSECRQAHVGVPTVATGVPPTGAREACRIFQTTGLCKWGASCHHMHVGGPAGSTASVAAARVTATIATAMGEVCQFFQRTGTCKWGSSCKYVHDRAAGPLKTGGQIGAYDLNGFLVPGKSSAPASIREQAGAYDINGFLVRGKTAAPEPDHFSSFGQYLE